MSLDSDPSRFYKSTTFEEINFSEGMQDFFTTFVFHFKGALFFLKWLYIGSKLDPYMPKNNDFPN